MIDIVINIVLLISIPLLVFLMWIVYRINTVDIDNPFDEFRKKHDELKAEIGKQLIPIFEKILEILK